MSSIAYESVSTIKAWSCHDCKSFKMEHINVYNNPAGDLQCFTGFSSTINGIILSWRGSSNIANWITNLSFNQVAYPKCSNCKVHNGFYSAWNLAKATVIQHIQDLRALHRGVPIYITGHSLGGALAGLSAVDIHHTFEAVHSLYTYGEPRIGNKQFADYYKTVITMYRVVHYADIVPHLPASAQGFSREGNEIWYDKAMATYKTCSYGEDSSCSNSLIIAYNTGDHSISTYVKLPTSFFESAANYLENMVD